MDQLPKDPIMLYSVINTKLRDQYPSLSALCEDLDVDENTLKERLAAVGFAYQDALNQFQ